MFLIYTRRSVEAGENTVSLAVQYNSCVKYARDNDLGNLHNHIEHNGVSGGDPKRWIALESYLLSNPVSQLLVYTMDRLGRDAAGTMSFLAFCARHGVAVHSVDQGVISADTSTGFLIAGLQAVVAEHQRLQIKEKVTAALALRKEQGKRVSRHAPFGFRHTRRGHVVEDPHEQEAIAAIRRIAVEDPVKGPHTIGRELFELGFKNRNGRGRIDHKVIRRLIRT